MSNIALEEKIRNLSADYIYQQAVGSLLLLLMSAMEDAEKGVTALPYEIPADVQEIKEEIKAYLIRLEDLLESDAASRMVALEDCMELKKRLLSIYETIYSYFSQWNIISTLVSDQIALRKYKEDGVSQKQVEWSLFFADCHAFMESAETLLDQKTYMGQLLKCIPLYMTRDKCLSGCRICRRKQGFYRCFPESLRGLLQSAGKSPVRQIFPRTRRMDWTEAHGSAA